MKEDAPKMNGPAIKPPKEAQVADLASFGMATSHGRPVTDQSTLPVKHSVSTSKSKTP
ncbi:MAG: hypothetical protein U0176_06015 [Bacteroidia bacterium]